ncbi:MAG TPA: polymer-forming cytoskeletal protein [Vicinamibacterales bacterium]|nr:polymer-forming cytoskeletal protein [Vicinamibacterales bacterium]
MTTIGASLTITGDLTSHEDVTIHGTLTGKISMQGGALLVAPTANVQGEAQGSRFTIHGSFSGDVTAAERVELSSTANVNGTVLAPAVILHDGAVFNGVMEVAGKKGRADKPFEPHAKAS